MNNHIQSDSEERHSSLADKPTMVITKFAWDEKVRRVEQQQREIADLTEHIEGIHRLILVTQDYKTIEDIKSGLISAEWACRDALSPKEEETTQLCIDCEDDAVFGSDDRAPYCTACGRVRTLCTNCKRINTYNELCVHCQNVDPEKGIPSKIAIVYPEGSLLQNVAIFAFNHLADSIDKHPELGTELAQEYGVSESELHEAVETLHTEN